ncbi:translation initiation factor IF-2-like [Cricetulus griseus]|uniref:Translation initiation factor IF-2-like n=1 Tax=Cricetulus griseus TaxID=10029 RepID=A0A9J7H7L1_CRIGR|nr:translation initiation factor IF-2-like [Cricetulus griseus]
MPARNKRPRLWEWTRPPTTPLARVVAPIPRAARNAPHENAPLLGDPLHPPLLQKEKEMFRKELRLWGEKPESLPVPLQSPVPLTEARKAAAVATESRPFPALGSARVAEPGAPEGQTSKRRDRSCTPTPRPPHTRTPAGGSPRADPGGSRAEVRRRARGSKASEEKGEAGALPGRPGPPRAALTWGGGGGRGLRDGASAGAGAAPGCGWDPVRGSTAREQAQLREARLARDRAGPARAGRARTPARGGAVGTRRRAQVLPGECSPSPHPQGEKKSLQGNNCALQRDRSSRGPEGRRGGGAPRSGSLRTPPSLLCVAGAPEPRVIGRLQKALLLGTGARAGFSPSVSRFRILGISISGSLKVRHMEDTERTCADVSPGRVTGCRETVFCEHVEDNGIQRRRATCSKSHSRVSRCRAGDSFKLTEILPSLPLPLGC